MRSSTLLFLLAGAAALAAFLIRERPDDERLEQAAERLQDRITLLTQELTDAVDAHAQGLGPSDPDSLWVALRPAPDHVRIYRNGRVMFWTDRAPIPDAALDTLTAAHVVLADGVRLHAFRQVGPWRVHGLRRVWSRPPFENRYLVPHFPEGLSPGEGIGAALGPGLGPVVRDAQGHVMFRLQWTTDTPPPGMRSMLSLLFAALAAGLAVAWLWIVSIRLHHPAASIALFGIPLLAARAFMLWIGPSSALAAYPLFDPSLFAASFFLPSLGDLLIDAGLLACLCAFLHQVLAGRSMASMSAALVALAVLFASALWMDGVLIALVRDGRVSLDLFHMQDFDVYGWLALLAIALLLAAWSLLADAAVRLFAPRLPHTSLLVAAVMMAIACALFQEVMDEHDAVLACWPVAPLVLLGAMRRQRPRTAHALALLGVFAFFTAHVLNRQTQKRIERDRAALVESATAGEDPVVELLFREAARQIRADATVRDLMKEGRPCSAVELDRAVRQAFFTGYWERYDIRLHLFGPGDALRCSTSPDAPPSFQQVRDRFDQGVPTAGDLDLRSVHRPSEAALYLGLVQAPGALGLHSLFVELRPRLIAEGLGFPELLLAGDRTAQQRMDRFSRARYERGALTESSGGYVHPVTWDTPLPNGGMHYLDKGYDLLAQGDPHGTVLVLGMRVHTWLDHVTTFSYVFLFFCMLTVVVALVRTVLRGRYTMLFSVNGKVRIGVALFAIVSVVLFAYGTQHLLDTRSAQRSGRALGERTRGALAELRQTLRGEQRLTPTMAPYLDHLLGKLSNVFFTDLTLYGPDGLVLATSREQMFNTGLLGLRMDPEAYRQMAVLGSESFIHEESIGTARFKASYLPFRNDAGEVLGYLALPYFARQSEMEQERTSSYVAMVNLFTLLFLLSLVAAAVITAWTTRPLQLLKRGLERIQLGARNEPLPYGGNDELGELVGVYNRKVDELRESAEKLARSERESAWREMAKQVAHEIKNPLTPMKLGIQHFQQTWDPQAPDAKARLDRFGSSLVEQIDALGRVANDFAQFARMSPAQETLLDLNEVAKSAVELFRGEPNADVTLLPALPLMVNADREHLLRVFNNLITNAVQAVPEERRGAVEVVLRGEAGHAIAEVRDNGSGIPEEAHERLFTPSFTTKSSGAGLGLAMVRRMVEQAGGRVWFTSRVEEGTTFFVSLPLVG